MLLAFFAFTTFFQINNFHIGFCFSDPYPTEQQRFEEPCAETCCGEPFGAESYRKSALDYRDPRHMLYHDSGAVLMVYGLDPLRTNADKLFNLVCLYGNVYRVSLCLFSQ